MQHQYNDRELRQARCIIYIVLDGMADESSHAESVSAKQDDVRRDEGRASA